jgi:hypothetical protein
MFTNGTIEVKPRTNYTCDRNRKGLVGEEGTGEAWLQKNNNHRSQHALYIAIIIFPSFYRHTSNYDIIPLTPSTFIQSLSSAPQTGPHPCPRHYRPLHSGRKQICTTYDVAFFVASLPE